MGENDNVTYAFPFIEDAEKMVDFKTLSKERFLESYSYLTETEYDITRYVYDLMCKTIYSKMIDILPYVREGCSKHFWTDGDTIYTDKEEYVEAIADFLEDLNVSDTVITGYFDPKEDENNGEVDRFTGLYYIEI